MDRWKIDATYPSPGLDTDVPPVVNLSHLSPESEGFSVQVDTRNFKWGDYVHLFWDGEFVDEAHVYAVTTSIDFLVPASILERHPARNQPGRKIEVFYVRQAYPASSLDGMFRSPSLVLDAKFSRPGGEDTNPDTPYVNDNLKPIEGAGGLVRAHDLILTVPVWANMEAGAQVTVYWGEKAIPVEASSIVVGKPVRVVVPWWIIDSSPQGIVSVTYTISDRVGNPSGNAPAVDVNVAFVSLLPPATFQYAVNAMGQLDTDLAIRMAAGTHDADSTPLVIEYPDVKTDDQIVVSLRGTTATDISVTPVEYMQFAGPVDPNQPPLVRYVFAIPIAWLSCLAGGTVFCTYVVKRGNLDFKSAARTRSVVGTSLPIPAPDVEKAPEDGDLLDLNSFDGDVVVAVEIFPIWPRGELTAFLQVRAKTPGSAFERSASLLQTDDHGRLSWALSRDSFANFPEGELSLVVVFKDSQGAMQRSRKRTLLFRPVVVPLEWPSLVVSGMSDGEQLALEDFAGDSLPVWLALNCCFQSGDQVTFDWQGTVFGPVSVEKPEGSLSFNVARSLVAASAGEISTTSYTVSRSGSVVGPTPARLLHLRIAPVTIGALPPPRTSAASGGTLDVDKAKSGIALTVPGEADVRDTDSLIFEVAAADGVWRRVASVVGDPRSAKVTTDDLIPSLGGSLSARYVVTRDGQSRVSDALSLTLGAYEKNDARLPRPSITQAQLKPTGQGNPYIDAKTLVADPLTVVVPPWPFMRAGQLVSVSVLGVDSSQQFATSFELAVKQLVLESDLANGLSLSVPRSWVMGQPKMPATDIQVVVVIERPPASESYRLMRLPIAVVNVVNLDEVGTGTGTGPGGRITVVSPPRSEIDLTSVGAVDVIADQGDLSPSSYTWLSQTSGTGEQYDGMTHVLNPVDRYTYNRYAFKRGRQGNLLVFDVRLPPGQSSSVFLTAWDHRDEGGVLPTFRLNVEGLAQPVYFQRRPELDFIARLPALSSTLNPIRMGLEIVPPIAGNLTESTVDIYSMGFAWKWG